MNERRRYIIKRIIKVSVCFLLLCVLLSCSVISATAVNPQNAWLIESSHINNGNYSPNVYGSIEDSPITGKNTLEFLHRFQTSIEMMGFSINHWLGTYGSPYGVYGYSNFGWEGSGEGTLYWVVLLYTVNISYNGGPYKASNYGWDPDYSTEEVDSFTGVLDLGVANVEATAGIYRVTNDITTQGGAYATRLNVNYQSGSYLSDGLLWPIITPMFYEEQTDAEKALDDIKQGIEDLNDGLFGDYSDSELDGIASAVGDLDDTAESIGGALDVSDFEVVNPDIADGTEGLPVLFSIYNILFENSWLVYIVSLALGMYVLKLILYGKAQ